MNIPARHRDDRRLSDFQKLMRSWKELAPYNAAHVLKISGAADRGRWEEALKVVLKQIEPGTERLRVETSSFELDPTVARELNRPFAAGEPPLRALIVVAGDDHHFLAFTYDHWWADSPSIRALLQRVFSVYRGDKHDLPPLHVDDSGGASRRSALAALPGAVRTYRRHRRASRIHLRDPLDFQTGFLSRHFPPGAIHRIRATARRHEAKVNDVFLAAAAQVLGEHTATQRADSRRRRFGAPRDQIGVASAIDLRDAGAEPAFGFAVSYYTVVLEDPEQTPLGELVRIVAQQTGARKTREEIAQFNLSLKCARLAWSLTSARQTRAELFRKGLPIVAAISNVNLSGSWVEAPANHSNGPRLLDYLRVSPVGPLLPLVFTLTTINDRLSLCVSFRTTAFSSQTAENLVAAFMAKLLAFDVSAPPR
jgi:hypothetical protein